ncbi:CoA transferase [Pseudonocardia sp. N23]|uniref:CaiB/BaiF CoA-transferase family protein n=1 Tax=Pseudonocardia sp. N23 TaxID=1987376 RepID=UPI000BFC939D|nr:CoA transferase [Pseudonocardia sp. N23]GAY11871.1 CAIB-BAIF family family [Pseudonocardia sp. N23]
MTGRATSDPLSSPFADRRVIDLSEGIAGGYCTKLLADAGAEVIKVETGTGDFLRHRNHGRDYAGDSPLFRLLAASKSSVLVDPQLPTDVEFVRSLIAAADVVVWSSDSALAKVEALHPETIRAGFPATSVVAISPFGLHGPWAHRAATDLTIQAWAGGLGQRGNPGQPPVAVGGEVDAWSAGTYAASAALATLLGGDPFGALIDVSILETSATTHALHPVTYRSMAGKPFQSVPYVNIPGIERTKDGLVGFMIITGQQWQDFCVLVERFDWLEDESLMYLTKRNARADEVHAGIEAWCAARTTDEIVELASTLRIPVAPIGNGQTVTTIEHFSAINAFVRSADGTFVQPSRSFRIDGDSAYEPGPAPRLGQHTEQVRAAETTPRTTGDAEPHAPSLPFEGLRVADLTQFWAGPSMSHFLGMLGAEVIHLESTRRPDQIRNNSVRALTEADWWEWSPMYQGLNTNKLDVTLDISSARGRELALKLFAQCDVLVENFSPRVLDNLDLTFEDLHEVNPRLIVVRMPGFGLSGPWRDFTGYAQTLEQASGMAWLTGHPDSPPIVPNGLCDPLSGAHAVVGLIEALVRRRKTGLGGLVEAPMILMALNLAAEQVAEYTAHGHLLRRTGNTSSVIAPQNLYLAADEEDGTRRRWVAIAVSDDAQWTSLCRVLDRPDWLEDARFHTAGGRCAHQPELDEALAAWCAMRASDDIVGTLWESDVPVAKVLMPHELDDIPQLDARRFWQDLDHPLVGRIKVGGHPAAMSNVPLPLHRSPAPMLGQHNEQVLCGLLGISEAEFAALEDGGLVGTIPAGATIQW